jgi:hypothetical protein
MGFGFIAEARRSRRGAKEDGRGFFTAKGEKGPRFEEPGRRGFCGLWCRLYASEFLHEAKRGGAECAEEDAEGLMSAEC